MNIIDGRGDFVALGANSLVERLPNGGIVKTPFEDPARGDCKRDLTTEATIYQLLGKHPRLIDIRSWDATQHALVMEYMPNGTLKQYISNNYKQIPQQEQLRWARQAAHGLKLLHASTVLHCDVGPHNFLLDADFNLKIADFSGSSVNGSSATICPSIRYRAPDPTWKPGKPPTAEEDLFSLGSLLYFIFTGYAPFHDLDEDIVESNFENGRFPDTSGLPFADVIERCWRQKVHSAEQVYQAIT